MKITCDDFPALAERTNPGELFATIRRDADPYAIHARGEQVSASSPGISLFESLVRDPGDEATARPGRDILLLSGGGQWGAYGAALFHRLSKDRGWAPPLDDIRVVTGISTGGLQSLYMAVILDPDLEEGRRRELLDDLFRRYSPTKESQLVNRNSLGLTVITGSVAGIRPLRRQIEEALCSGGEEAGGCQLLAELAKSPVTALIGFVEAESGDLYYVDANKVARSFDMHDPAVSVQNSRRAQQCLTGAALSSAAMPVFFQQVRVGPKENMRAYYDGGVRRSVFLAEALERVTAMVESRAGAALTRMGEAIEPSEAKTLADSIAPNIYVLRNGPTTRSPEKKPNRSSTPGTNAFRAYDLIVNELEVGAIAGLRQIYPYGRIEISTADGWNGDFTGKPEQCEKTKNIMFDPQFMRCLHALAECKAAREGSAWWSLDAIEPPLVTGEYLRFADC